MLLLMIVTCSALSDPPTASAAPAPLPDSAPPATVAAPPTAPGGIRGSVVENLPAGNYTYTRVRSPDGAEVWAAAPGAAPPLGATVEISTELPMAGFHSDVLKRDFEMVYFVGSFNLVGGAASREGIPSWHPEVSEGEECPPISAEQIAAAIATNTAPVTGLSQTVAEVWKDRAALSGKQVTVRGEVVKFASGIMGKNWIHVRDGTGEAQSNDLTVTTISEAKVGDRVALTGTVLVDQDYGYGYAYAVILSEAHVSPLLAGMP